MNVNTEPKYEIVLTDKFMAVKSGTPTFDDILFSTINACLNEAVGIVKHFEDTEPEKAPTAKAALFDMMNLAFSNALHAFDPEVDLHPELTPEDMLEEENKALDEALANDDQLTFSELMEGDAISYEEIQKLS